MDYFKRLLIWISLVAICEGISNVTWTTVQTVGNDSYRYQIEIASFGNASENMLTQEYLLDHVELLESIAQAKLFINGRSWSLADFCVKFEVPATKFDEAIVGMGEKILTEILPCVIVTPLDCFWEGSKPLGPFPPMDTGNSILRNFVPSLPVPTASHKNLNFEAILQDVETFLDLDAISDYFKSSGVGTGYQKRPCLDPWDPECPKTAPNAIKNWCEIAELYDQWKKKHPNFEPETTTEAAKSTTTDPNSLDAFDDLFGSYGDDYDYDFYGEYYYTSGNDTVDEECRSSQKRLSEIFHNQPELVNEVLPQSARPALPDLGALVYGGCRGYASNLHRWSEDQLFLGVSYAGQNGKATKIGSVEALKSTVFIKHVNELRLQINGEALSKKSSNDVLKAWMFELSSNFSTFPDPALETSTATKIEPENTGNEPVSDFNEMQNDSPVDENQQMTTMSAKDNSGFAVTANFRCIVTAYAYVVVIMDVL